MKEVKICKNCKWCNTWIDNRSKTDEMMPLPFFWKCSSPKNIKIVKNERLLHRIVGGEEIKTTKDVRHKLCVANRSYNWFFALLMRACGKYGRWFEPIDKEKEKKDEKIEVV